MTGHALCVGINQFEHLPTANWLNGCVNDANDIAALLGGQLGVGPGDITTLTDAQATKAAVMKALTDLITRGKTGEIDRVVFTLSSHGTQVPDTNGDEADHADEAFAMYDIQQAGDSWDVNTVIVDDELHTLFSGLPTGLLVEVVLDTCHSGTGLRSLDFLPGRRPRFLPPPTSEGLDAVESADPVGLRDLVKGGTKGRPPVLYAACRADQTASDAQFGDRYNGAFTYYLIQTLKANAAQTRLSVLSGVSTGLRGGKFAQRAQLEAPPTAKKVAFGHPW